MLEKPRNKLNNKTNCNVDTPFQQLGCANCCNLQTRKDAVVAFINK